MDSYRIRSRIQIILKPASNHQDQNKIRKGIVLVRDKLLTGLVTGMSANRVGFWLPGRVRVSTKTEKRKFFLIIKTLYSLRIHLDSKQV
jgi:hypothetical protein